MNIVPRISYGFLFTLRIRISLSDVFDINLEVQWISKALTMDSE